MNTTSLTEQNEAPRQGRFKSLSKRMGKRSFYAWIAYQTIKGTLTTLFIWAPMVYYYFSG